MCLQYIVVYTIKQEDLKNPVTSVRCLGYFSVNLSTQVSKLFLVLGYVVCWF